MAPLLLPCRFQSKRVRQTCAVIQDTTQLGAQHARPVQMLRLVCVCVVRNSLLFGLLLHWEEQSTAHSLHTMTVTHTHTRPQLTHVSVQIISRRMCLLCLSSWYIQQTHAAKFKKGSSEWVMTAALCSQSWLALNVGVQCSFCLCCCYIHSAWADRLRSQTPAQLSAALRQQQTIL